MTVILVYITYAIVVIFAVSNTPTMVLQWGSKVNIYLTKYDGIDQGFPKASRMSVVDPTGCL